MGVVDRVLGYLGLARVASLGDEVETAVSHEVNARLWEATRNDRLNSQHWGRAQNTSINAYLLTHLESARARALYETCNNPILDGLIKSHAIDVVGKRGPILAVESKDRIFADTVEREFAKWASIAGHNSKPDRPVSLVNILKTGIRELWQAGEIVLQKTSRRDGAGPIRLRLKPISSRRIVSPISRAGDPSILMGVELNEQDDVVAYYVDAASRRLLEPTQIAPTRIRARNMLVYFDPVESEQVRGYPWLMTCLGTAADMRDYDLQVLDAARQAADNAILLHSDHPDARFLNVNATTEVERRTIKTLPPGWRATQMTPQQPSSTYKDFRDIRIGDFGRSRGIPFIQVKLDASGANYSSARIDVQKYGRTNEEIQGDLERAILNPVLAEIIYELQLRGIIGDVPDDIGFRWGWTKLPHVDPQKEAKATEIRGKNGLETLRDALRESGASDDWQAHIDQIAAEQDYARKRGVTLFSGTSDLANADREESSSGAESESTDGDKVYVGGSNGVSRLW